MNIFMSKSLQLKKKLSTKMQITYQLKAQYRSLKINKKEVKIHKGNKLRNCITESRVIK